VQSSADKLTEKDLKNWGLLQVFEEAVERVFSKARLHPSFSHGARALSYRPYLSLFLFGLFNPAVESMRGLCGITELKRVQEEVCRGKVSPASFSEMQHLLEPELLRQVFGEVMKQTPGNAQADARLVHLNLIAQDGSLWRALPRMAWAEYGVGRKGDAKGVRLHLRFHVTEDKPVDARITKGSDCERQALRQMCVPGQTNVGDRYYGEDYQLFGEIDQAKAFLVIRIKQDAVINLEEELTVSPEDRAAGVVRHAWVRLGARAKKRSIRLRLVEIRAGDQHLLLVTNLTVDQASAQLVGLIYRRRWSIELFFRWIKCILGCRHFFAESPDGVALQLYLALIAALLFQQYSGRRPSKRQMELIQMYLLGWATAEELVELLQRQLERKVPRKTS
jgi:DDE family transposase